MTGSPSRLAVVLSHPTQYYSPWFRWIASHTTLNLRVFYLWDFGVTEQLDPQFEKSFKWDVDLLSGYDHEFVPNVAKVPGTDHFQGLNNPGLRARLLAWKPDALLLFGYAYRTHLQLIAQSAFGRLRLPLLFRGDSHLLGGPPPSLAKRLSLRWLYANFSAFLAVGLANADYFRAFGAPSRRIFRAPHAVDAVHFQPTPTRLAEAAQLRQQLGIPSDARVLLFSGKFTPQKCPRLLLDAFREASASGSHLIFAGDGELRSELETAAAGDARVHFLPFANQSAMPVRYLLGDVFVLPSQGRYETWGLAVNEAMHTGRPAIVSDVVGCQRDLIVHGETGWVFPSNHRQALAAVIHQALTLSREKIETMGATAQRHAAQYSYQAATDGLLAALNHMTRR